MPSCRELVIGEVTEQGLQALAIGDKTEAESLGLLRSTLEEMTDSEFDRTSPSYPEVTEMGDLASVA